MKVTTAEVLSNLESGAKRLSAHDLPYLAYLTLESYAGECATETKDARLRAARTYLDYSRYLTAKLAMPPPPEHTVSDDELQEIIHRTQCKWGYECLDNSKASRCSIVDIGSKCCLQCLATHSTECGHLVACGETKFCECPLRIYLAKRSANG